MKACKIMQFLFAALAVFGLSTYASADTWNQKTRITINETIEVPGATLTPGTYVVKLVDSQSSRHIVRIMNANETKAITTILAIPDQREHATSDSQFTFYEMPIGNHPALRSWFYPGRLIGQQFVYPKKRAMEIANASGMYVPSMAEDSNKYMSDQRENDEYLNAYRKSEVNAYGKGNQAITYADAVAKNKAVQPTVPAKPNANRLQFEQDTNLTASNRSTSSSQGAQTLAQNRNLNQYNASSELPRTASNMPLVLAMAFLLIGGGLAIRRFA